MYNYEQDPRTTVESLRDERVRRLDSALYNLKTGRAHLTAPTEAPEHFPPTPQIVTAVSNEAERLAALREQIEKEAA